MSAHEDAFAEAYCALPKDLVALDNRTGGSCLSLRAVVFALHSYLYRTLRRAARIVSRREAHMSLQPIFSGRF